MNTDKTRTNYEALAKQAAGEKVDVLARILNCGESMRDVHDVAAELIKTAQMVGDRCWTHMGNESLYEMQALRAVLARIGSAS